jgi:4'-phosphopantetheinyl transferase
MNEAGNASPAPIEVRVWTMETQGLDEAAVAPWAAVLDAGERARAARFAFAAGRVGFIAAHALARAGLAAATGAAPEAFAFAAGAHGKPAALLAGRPAGVAFNLAHTEGMVGVAVARAPGLALGFDIEPLARRAPLEVARRYFAPAEAAALEALPEAERAGRFFCLWTLKEAFIKATGKGLTQDLASFAFSPDPPAISFAPGLDEDARAWSFVQRRLKGGFVAALGVRARAVATVWREVPAAGWPGGIGCGWRESNEA